MFFDLVASELLARLTQVIMTLLAATIAVFSRPLSPRLDPKAGEIDRKRTLRRPFPRQ